MGQEMSAAADQGGTLVCCMDRRRKLEQLRSPLGGAPRLVTPETEEEASSSASSRRRSRHLVLHMDINKTVLMSDQVASKPAKAMVNEVMADVAWGEDSGGRWVLAVEEPTATRPRQDLRSYAEWLEEAFPGRELKKRRNESLATFTAPGQPGEALARHAERLIACLTAPDGSEVRLIPAFFELLLWLKREKRSFSLCFRTFGEDLASTLEELNSFCEGRHRQFPGVRMDGSDGCPDYRVIGMDPTRCGTFHRKEDCTSLVMGTWEQPGEGRYRNATDRSLGFYSAFPDLKVISGLEAVHEFVHQSCSRCGTMGLRDHFQFWMEQGQTSKGGKLFFVDPSDARRNRHEMFFDDNIRYSDAFIVQVVNPLDPARSQWVTPLLRTHLCRATPWESVADRNWFVRQVQRLEDGFDRKLFVQRRLSARMRQISQAENVIDELKQLPAVAGRHLRERRHDRAVGEARTRAPRPEAQAEVEPYDPWRGHRRHDSELSIRSVDEGG